MIQCKLCKKEFKSLIGWRHLKTHNITTKQYKEQYGEVSTDAYKQMKGASFSKINKGRVAHNKGSTITEAGKLHLHLKAKERNKIWADTGTHPLLGTTRTDETKQKIRDARATQIIKPESVRKAIATKIRRGYDLAFFRGKTHTNETKKKISLNSIITNQKKSALSHALIKTRLNEQNLSLVGNFQDTLYNLICTTCKSSFSITKQYLQTEKKYNPKLCDVCHPRPIIKISKGEQEVADWLKLKNINIIQSVRSIIKPYEIDIFLPDHNIGIEYCGLYWHSELAGKDSKYHLNKRTMANENGIHLITMFEDEWENKSNIVKSRLMNLLSITDQRIFARKCTISEISSKVANKFLKDNHIQGSGRSNIRYGLFFNSELVSIMTFSESNISRKSNMWEINRFCNKLNMGVVGGASKLFNAFISNNTTDIVISFADKRWSSDNAFYTNLGFTISKHTQPSYWYIAHNDLTRYHRFALRKTKTDNQNLTEWENRQRQNWNRIWDCGSIKYEWKRAVTPPVSS